MEFSVWPRAKALPGGEHISNQIIGGCHGRGVRVGGRGLSGRQDRKQITNTLAKADRMLE